MSLGFGTSLGEFLNIEPGSNSIIKCLSHIQLKLIPKNVKNHSYCAIGIISQRAQNNINDLSQEGNRNKNTNATHASKGLKSNLGLLKVENGNVRS